MTGIFDDFIRKAALDCVNGSSGSMYAKPSLEAPPVGTICEKCGEYLALVDYCAVCEERER